MSPGSYTDDIWSRRIQARGGSSLWALLVALMFIGIATTSFALEQTVTLSCLSKSTSLHMHPR
jgi:hypothetical protein